MALPVWFSRFVLRPISLFICLNRWKSCGRVFVISGAWLGTLQEPWCYRSAPLRGACEGTDMPIGERGIRTEG